MFWKFLKIAMNSIYTISGVHHLIELSTEVYFPNCTFFNISGTGLNELNTLNSIV